MESSQSKSKSNKNKNWNIFRSPQQKDLFDFLQHDQIQQLKDFNKQNPLFNSHNQKNKSKHKQKSSTFSQNQVITQQKQLQDNDQNSWRSNLTFNTKYHQQQSSQIKSQRNKDLFFRATNSKHKKSILNQQEEDLLQTSRLKQVDSLSNIFLKQITQTQQNQNLSNQQQKKKLFENIRTTDNFGVNYFDNQLILKTLNDIKQINKQNLFVNKKILSAMILQKNERPTKNTNNSHQTVKSTQKKNSIQRNLHQTSSKGFSQSRKEFYLYEKPMKAGSNSKLNQNKTNFYKLIGLSNATKLSNLTKLSLNHNATKLSLGDKTQTSYKLQANTQSKSTIKKVKCGRKMSNLQIHDHIEQKLNQIDKIKSSLKMVMKENVVIAEKKGNKSTNKKTSKSQYTIRC